MDECIFQGCNSEGLQEVEITFDGTVGDFSTHTVIAVGPMKVKICEKHMEVIREKTADTYYSVGPIKSIKKE